MNLQNYFPVLLFIIVATLIGLALLGAGRLLGPHRPYDEKLSPYECGFEAFGDSRMKVDIRYYLIAILFIMFDLEIAFLFPWAMAQGAVGIVGFGAVMVFLLILTVGFIYEWKKGALDWE
ncbi:NADH-quinone oxidoreductase subunit A [Paenalcaligenes hominis]|uniref:NADH-quinone oxidoreductase subunit A n=1 Tax=Paenalcaligenes hominis TaxID=643674 RepID=UPI0035247CF0